MAAAGGGGCGDGGLAALAWVAFKVGALSYGGGFVIIPLMQHDAVEHYHWMTDGQFLNAVALGQITPGPVVHTVAVVGYAAAGIGGGLLAAAVAFAPSFSFILHRRRALRPPARQPRACARSSTAPGPPRSARSSARPSRSRSRSARPGSSPCSPPPLSRSSPLRRGVVLTLVTAGAVGALASALGAPLPT